MIEDTSKRDLIVHADGVLGAGMDDYVTGMERNGQAQVVTSTLLPIPDDPAPYEALGFTFGEKTDDMFCEATLPEGWTKDGSDHAMWSYVLDADGYRRVAIFYKAAFYDRRADIHIERVPSTRAQNEAYQKVTDLIGYGGKTDYAEPFWRAATPRREGPNYVYVYSGCKGEKRAEADDDRYNHGGLRTFADDGRRIEIEVAPDGEIVGQREFTVDPEPDEY